LKLNFQENTSMKKMLLVIGILLLASSAFAAGPTTYTFTFDGFCDGMTLILGTGAQASNVAGPKIFVAGTHNLCGPIYINSGFKHGISKVIPPFASPVLDVGDPELAQYINVQYLVQPTPACVWANYYSVDGAHNNNFLSGTCTLGARALGKGTKSTFPSAR
jgi:hypothetical protein